MKPAIKPVVLHTPTISALPAESFPAPAAPSISPFGDVTWRTLLTASKTPSDTFVSGIGSCRPKGGFLALHRHTHAEIYYVIDGSGVVHVEGEEYEVRKGSVVFIPGDAVHGVVNRGAEADGELRWLYVFAARDFGDVVYRFEGEGHCDERGLNVKSKL